MVLYNCDSPMLTKSPHMPSVTIIPCGLFSTHLETHYELWQVVVVGWALWVALEVSRTTADIRISPTSRTSKGYGLSSEWQELETWKSTEA
jgi:hypothetical protein